VDCRLFELLGLWLVIKLMMRISPEHLGQTNEFVPDRPIDVPGLKAPKLESTVDIEGTHESILAADQNYILPDVQLIIDPANNPSEDRIWVFWLLPR